MPPVFFSSFVWVLLVTLAGATLAQGTEQARKKCVEIGFKDKTVSHGTCMKQVLQTTGSTKAPAKPMPNAASPPPKPAVAPTPVVLPPPPVRPPPAMPVPSGTPVEPSSAPAIDPVTPGATGAMGATGSAAQVAGPSASYGGRIVGRIRPNITFLGDMAGTIGNPGAEVEVRAAADGTIISRKLLKSSGIKAWDEAVLKAIDKTEILPRDVDGRVPSELVISFRPKD
jgi:TonB family protein